MRFFSNDARQPADDQTQVDEHPERVQSEPVPVPQQRPPSPSPWAATPGTRPDVQDRDVQDRDVQDRDVQDRDVQNRDVQNRDVQDRDSDPDRDPRVRDDQQAVGALAVDTDDAVDTAPDRDGGDLDLNRALNPDSERDAEPNRHAAPDDDDDRNRADRHLEERGADDRGADQGADDRYRDDDLAEDELAARETRDGTTEAERRPFYPPEPQATAFGAGTVGGAVAASATAGPHTDVTGPHTDVTGPHTDFRNTDEQESDAVRIDDPDGFQRRDDSIGGTPNDVIDAPLQDGGTFEDPVVVDSGGDARTFAGTAPASAADRASGADDPLTGGQPVAGQPLAGQPVPAAVSVDSLNGGTGTGDEAANVPSEESLPGTVPPPELGPLFADTDAHAFRERWRDVQLRFVDDPKAAADEAATLVDEAVDALAASLRSQKDQLTGAAANDMAGDTEQLRVRIRSYRDFLDRLLGL
jgi:hypothetical protein